MDCIIFRYEHRTDADGDENLHIYADTLIPMDRILHMVGGRLSGNKADELCIVLKDGTIYKNCDIEGIYQGDDLVKRLKEHTRKPS